MKRNLLILMTMLFISHSVIAETEKSNFYLKASVGGSKVNTVKQIHKDLINSTTKSKSKISPDYSIGAGYYINDFIRTDLTFAFTKVTFKKGNNNFTIPEDDDYYEKKGNLILDRKADIYSVMLNTYADFAITSNVKLFAGVGGGVAQVREKGTVKIDLGVINQNGMLIDTTSVTESVSSKRKNNFAYSLTLGTAIQLTESTNLELAYSWKDYGKTKPKIDSDGEPTHDKNRYRGHHVVVGIRFDI